MFHASVTDAATILAARRKTGEQGARLPESCRPGDVDTALAIQSAVVDQSGERIGAWKCGMPVEYGPVLAPIHADTICSASPCAARAHAGQIRIEPELAFILDRDLPARDEPYAPAEVDAAISATHLALELIDSRYDDHAGAGFLDNLADGLLNQGLFLGPQIDNDTARTAATMTIDVTADTGQMTRLDGRHPAVEPRAPLYWLAEFLRSKGQGLQAGQAVITGSYVPSFEVPVGQDIVIRYGSLGELRVHFLQK